MENKTTINPEIQEWPYKDIVARFNRSDRSWRETSSSTYEEQLGAVPPARQDGGTFVDGEVYTYTDDGPIHAVFTYYEGRYFCKLDALHDFDVIRYHDEIENQFKITDKAEFTCATCKQVKSTDEIADSKDGDLFCEDCVIDRYLPAWTY